ncbi:MAG: methylated-DNA--[protein]-cysteine S-methyltransferase [Candidatus Eremiobacterota bacterium]
MTRCVTLESPLGRMLAVAREGRLTGLYFVDQKYAPANWRETESDQVLLEACRQVEEYFAGRRREFQLSVDPEGTRFQREVWDALVRVPYGETRSYGQIAREIGNPAAVRAVGAAVGRNPLTLLVPCHRILGANGALTGFAGGTHRKRALLELEKSFPG